METTASYSALSASVSYTSTEIIQVKSRPIDEIREIGFQAFFEKMQSEKLQKLYDDILSTIGYTTEEIDGMSSEERIKFHDLIQVEIAQRMFREAHLGHGLGGVIASFQSLEVDVTQVQVTGALVNDTDLSALLALQEEEVTDAAGTTHGTERERD